MLPGVNDLGGVLIDLKGGDYKLSTPIRFPPNGGANVVIQDGSLRASENFPFTTDGILVEGGHEVFVSSSFLGQIETIGGDKKEKAFYGTAINLNGNDHAVTDVAIFSAATGANILTGVHCYNKATFFGGVGIHATTSGSKTRIDNCYLDYNSILLEDPSETHITNTFFLGDGNVKLKAVKGEAKGLTVVNNMFSGNNGWVPIVQLDESQAKFQKVEQVVVDNNMVNTMALKTTVARMTVAGKGKHWTADFRSVLTFPDLINHVSYSLYLKGGNRLKIPRHAITAVVNNTVVVESSEIVDAIVSVAVDQYLALGETNYL
ncbi:hypothetical protein LUZ60_017290 [Juncus effusus]|nr:hypothetical protein LUZ60_017290 [Juncus effusus]